MAARLGTLSYWTAFAVAIYFFLSSALCFAVLLGFVQGNSADALLTAIFCATIGFSFLMCGIAFRVLLTERW
jgi:hypothetical protein